MKTSFALLLYSVFFSLSNAYAGDAACPILFKKDKLCASMTWVKKPVAVEMPTSQDAGEFMLKFFKKGSSPTEGPFVQPSFPVTVKLSMPDMETHTAPIPVVNAVEGQTGVYSVKEVLFSMPGDWEISISGRGRISFKL